jgi:hypothetical protein
MTATVLSSEYILQFFWNKLPSKLNFSRSLKFYFVYIFNQIIIIIIIIKLIYKKKILEQG